MKFRDKLRLGKPKQPTTPDEPHISQLKVIQEDESGKVVDLGDGFKAIVVYKTATGDW